MKYYKYYELTVTPKEWGWLKNNLSKKEFILSFYGWSRLKGGTKRQVTAAYNTRGHFIASYLRNCKERNILNEEALLQVRWAKDISSAKYILERDMFEEYRRVVQYLPKDVILRKINLREVRNEIKARKTGQWTI